MKLPAAASRFRCPRSPKERAGGFIRLELQGGGGCFGNPAERDAEQVALDVADGLISRETAVRDYRAALAADGSMDFAATTRLRASLDAE